MCFEIVFLRVFFAIKLDLKAIYFSSGPAVLLHNKNCCVLALSELSVRKKPCPGHVNKFPFVCCDIFFFFERIVVLERKHRKCRQANAGHNDTICNS